MPFFSDNEYFKSVRNVIIQNEIIFTNFYAILTNSLQYYAIMNGLNKIRTDFKIKNTYS